MTLEQLKTYLEGAASGTDIQMVIFDFLAYANTANRDKQYPLIVWDLDNLGGNRDFNAGSDTDKLNIDIYCMDLVTPEDDVAAGKIPVWDAIEADLQEYLRAVNQLDYLGIPNSKVDFELYPAGMLSMERELGVLYKAIGLELWC